MKTRLSELLNTLRLFSDRDVEIAYDRDAALIVRVEATIDEVREALETAQDEDFAKAHER